MNKQRRFQVLHTTIIILLTIALALTTAPGANAGAVETVTNTNDSGAGSLRQAIADVDAGGTIEFAAGVSGTIVLSSGELVIDKSLTINGPGADVLTVSGNNLSRVFFISGDNVTLSGLTVADGNDSGGGGMRWDWGSMLTINNCTFLSNESDRGGAACLNGGTVHINNSTFLENTADDHGGALRLEELTFNVTNSTFYNNTAGRQGGAIVVSEDSIANISNSTFSGNTANGAVWNSGGGGAIAIVVRVLVNIKNSIVVGNNAPERPDSDDILIFDALTSFDFNLLGTVLNLGTFTPATNDQVGVTAAQVNLGALAIEAPGTIATLPLQEGSIAIDGITDAAQCTDVQGNPVATDQRGITRPQGAFCDIGAYEVEVVTDSDGDGVPDVDDHCQFTPTLIPESVPTVKLNPNHWALVDGDWLFDTVSKGEGNGPGRSYTTTDTAGCSCEQIIAAQGLGAGHTEFGCSISAMDEWVALVNP